MKITSILINICGHLLLAAIAVLLLAVLSSCNGRPGEENGSGQNTVEDSLQKQDYNSETDVQRPMPRDCVRVDSVKNW